MTFINRRSAFVAGWLVALLLGGAAASIRAADSVPADPGVPISAEQQFQQGTLAYQRGAFDQAVVSWTRAADLYGQAGNGSERAESLVRLGEAYHALAQYRSAAQSLESAQRLVAQLGDRTREARIVADLGHLYLAAGQEEEAARYLSDALRLSRELHHVGLSAVVLNNLGTLAGIQKRQTDALAAFGESFTLAKADRNQALAVRALMNTATAFVQETGYRDAKMQFDRALEYLQKLDPSYDKAFALITIGLAYHRLSPHLPNMHTDLMERAHRAFTEAGAVAEAIGDPRIGSYAWGALGGLYETEERYPEALNLTRQAIFLAQQVVAPESLFRWHWQAGRVLKKMGKPDEALDAMRRAVYAAESVRPELAVAYGSGPSSFREGVGGVYFDLADLLLQRAAALADPAQAEPYLKEARDTVELLKVAELRDYFHDDCVDAARSRVTGLEAVSQTAAVVYPILLPDRLELLVSLPSGMRRVSVPVGVEQITKEVRTLRKRLEKRTTVEYLPHAQQMYDWLIRPLEPMLAGSSIDTLVFVPDGPLRTIPMAALHDGKEFLISQYAVATTPGLTLTDPRALTRERIQVLSAGLSQRVQGFPSLPNVPDELEAVRGLYGGTVLLNQDFVASRFEHEVKAHPFSIMHIATHGQFESDSRKTFLLTFDDKLTMDRLDAYIGLFRFRDQPLGLLTLSACKTAAGDDRAALGLAGVAIRAGARSALATLWFINDQASTALVSEFYRQLKDGSVSKAVALQRAQLKLMQDPIYQHPAYWSPFLLLNNWL